jgi:hypothetical protein
MSMTESIPISACLIGLLKRRSFLIESSSKVDMYEMTEPARVLYA